MAQEHTCRWSQIKLQPFHHRYEAKGIQGEIVLFPSYQEFVDSLDCDPEVVMVSQDGEKWNITSINGTMFLGP